VYMEKKTPCVRPLHRAQYGNAKGNTHGSTHVH